MSTSIMVALLCLTTSAFLLPDGFLRIPVKVLGYKVLLPEPNDFFFWTQVVVLPRVREEKTFNLCVTVSIAFPVGCR